MSKKLVVLAVVLLIAALSALPTMAGEDLCVGFHNLYGVAWNFSEDWQMITICNPHDRAVDVEEIHDLTKGDGWVTTYKLAPGETRTMPRILDCGQLDFRFLIDGKEVGSRGDGNAQICEHPTPTPTPTPEPGGETPTGTGYPRWLYLVSNAQTYICYMPDGTERIWASNTMPPGSTFNENGVEYTTSWNGPCAPVVTKASLVTYGNCESKLLVTRFNRKTVKNWDSVDIIGVKDPQDPESFWNVSNAWGTSDDQHASLSWDACWFAVQRRLSDSLDQTIWWSDFGNTPYPVKYQGETIKGVQPDVGPNGEIVFVSTEGLKMTDRYGSFMRNLGQKGASKPEFSASGKEIWFVDDAGYPHAIDLSGRPVRMVGVRQSGVNPKAEILHSDPNSQLVFFVDPTDSLDLSGFMGLSVQKDLRVETQDLAVQPGSEAGMFVHEGELCFTPDWRNAQGEQVSDPFNGSETIRAKWTDPDWRN